VLCHVCGSSELFLEIYFSLIETINDDDGDDVTM
jgi:hypothetical protein